MRSDVIDSEIQRNSSLSELLPIPVFELLKASIVTPWPMASRGVLLSPMVSVCPSSVSSGDINALTWECLKIFFWYFIYWWHMTGKLLLLKIGVIHFILGPLGGIKWKHKNYNNSSTIQCNLMKFVWWLYLMGVHNISFGFFIWPSFQGHKCQSLKSHWPTT